MSGAVQLRATHKGATDYIVTGIKKLSVAILGFASASVLARYLGTDLRGEYAFVMNAVAVFVVFLNFGVNSSFFASRRQHGFPVVRLYVIYSLLLFGALFTITLLLAPLSVLRDQHLAILIVGSFSLLRMQVQSYCLVEHIKGAAVSSVMASFLEFLVIGAIYLIAPAALSIGLLAVMVKEATLSFLSLFFLWRAARAGPASRRGPTKAVTLGKRRVSSIPPVRRFGSLPFFVLTILIVLNYKIDVFFLQGFHVPWSEIGIFAVGVLVAEYLWIFSDVFKDVQISRTSRGGGAEDVAFAHRMALAVTLIVYVVFIFAGKLVISLAFGPEYQESYAIAIFMLLANLFMLPCKIIGAFYISTGSVRVYLLALVGAIALNMALNFFLIPLYGIYGAVGASVVSYSFAGIVMIFHFVQSSSIALGKVVWVRWSEWRALGGNFAQVLKRARSIWGRGAPRGEEISQKDSGRKESKPADWQAES